jgi:hypothetical protein
MNDVDSDVDTFMASRKYCRAEAHTESCGVESMAPLSDSGVQKNRAAGKDGAGAV